MLQQVARLWVSRQMGPWPAEVTQMNKRSYFIPSLMPLLKKIRKEALLASITSTMDKDTYRKVLRHIQGPPRRARTPSSLALP